MHASSSPEGAHRVTGCVRGGKAGGPPLGKLWRGEGLRKLAIDGSSSKLTVTPRVLMSSSRPSGLGGTC